MGTRVVRMALALAALAAEPAGAVDGVIEINQASALAGGITPGDGGGFPVTLSLPGSYRFTGNLELPSLATPAVEVTAADVSIDLNGFGILGLNTCGSLAFNGTGMGIDSSVGTNTVVRNGTVKGTGYGAVWGAVHVENVRVLCSWRGIFVTGGRRARIVGNTVSGTAESGIGAASFAELVVVEGNVVEGSFIALGKAVVTGNVVNAANAVHAIRATGVIANNQVTGPARGIEAEAASTIVGNSVYATGNDAIFAASGSTIKDNTVTNSGADGIQCGSGCTVVGNTVRGSTGFGLAGGSFTGYGDNVFTNNTAGSVSALPLEIGTNVCDTDTICP